MIPEELRPYLRHKLSCKLSRPQIPSFAYRVRDDKGKFERGCDNYFKHYGGQCNEKLEAISGRSWWHCMRPAGHSEPHQCSRVPGSSDPTEWYSGECTCGLYELMGITPDVVLPAKPPSKPGDYITLVEVPKRNFFQRIYDEYFDLNCTQKNLVRTREWQEACIEARINHQPPPFPPNVLRKR